IVVVSWGFLFAGTGSLVALIVGVVLLDLGLQGSHISNQSEVYRLDPAARSRITTVYMSLYFCGGALGSGLTGPAYAAYGWAGACRNSARASSLRPSLASKSPRTLGNHWYRFNAGTSRSRSTMASAAAGPSAIPTATARFSSTTGEGATSANTA